MNIFLTFVLDVYIFLSTIWSNNYVVLLATEPVQCEFDAVPVKFGDDVRIFCQSTKADLCVKQEKRMWMTGQSKDILLQDGAPSQNDKRHQEIIESCKRFSLKISNFSETDLITVYWCSIGFDTCRIPTLLSAGYFKYVPTAEEMITSVYNQDGYLNVYISILKIYPLPNCSRLYEIKCVQNISVEHHLSGPFYSFDLRLKLCILQEDCDDCQPISKLSCLLGNNNITFSILNVSITADHQYHNDIHCIIIMVAIVLVCLVILIQSIYRNKTEIVKCFKQLPDRQFKDLRRPMLGIFFVVGAFVFVHVLIIFSLTPHNAQKCHNGNPAHVSVMVFAFLFSNVSMGFISNPDTISIRKGFTTSVKRFITKWTHCSTWIMDLIGRDSNDTIPNNRAQVQLEEEEALQPY